MTSDTKAYYEKEGYLSNSLLKLITNPVLFKQRMDGEYEKEDKEFFRLGSAVDCLLTSPETFDADFHVLGVSKPGGLLGDFVSNLPLGLEESSPLELYQEAYDESGYKLPLATVVTRFWNSYEGRNYYYALHNVKEGKTALSKDIHETALKCVDKILNTPYTREYFVSGRFDLCFQVAIYFKYRDLDFKALLDGVVIDHESKTITPFDLKTTGYSVYTFPKVMVDLGYFRQASLYHYAVQQETSPFFELIKNGYEVKPFEFVVVETRESVSPPLVYQVSEQDLAAGFTGGYTGNTFVKGIDQLIDDYIWHRDHDLWEYPRYVYEHNGVIPTNSFKVSQGT